MAKIYSLSEYWRSKNVRIYKKTLVDIELFIVTQMRVANAAVRALTRVYGTSYKAGTSSNIICKFLTSTDPLPFCLST